VAKLQPRTQLHMAIEKGNPESRARPGAENLGSARSRKRKIRAKSGVESRARSVVESWARSVVELGSVDG